MIKILFAEDDEIIASGIVYALEKEGYAVLHCKTKKEALLAVSENRFSLAVLDLTLPDGTGYEIFNGLKEKSVPVIFLTAASDEGNIVMGLEMGAEDFITKPFRLKELLARIKVVLRRSHTKETVIRAGNDVEIHTASAKVYVHGEEIVLTALEYKILLTLSVNKGQILTRNQLLENIWDIDGSFVNDNTLTVYIKRLREKLNIHGGELIVTVRGMGYTIHD